MQFEVSAQAFGFRPTLMINKYQGAIDQALIDYKTEFERDRATDAEYLEAEFRRLKTDDKALIQRLDISQNQLEALAAVHYVSSNMTLAPLFCWSG